MLLIKSLFSWLKITKYSQNPIYLFVQSDNCLILNLGFRNGDQLQRIKVQLRSPLIFYPFIDHIPWGIHIIGSPIAFAIGPVVSGIQQLQWRLPHWPVQPLLILSRLPQTIISATFPTAITNHAGVSISLIPLLALELIPLYQKRSG